MRILLLSVFTLFALSLNAQKKAVDVTFKEDSLALGKVKKGEKKTFKYHFTNSGTETIEIDIVSGCDCTTLDWTRGKIRPGEEGVIDVIFDSSEKEDSDPVDVDMYLKNVNPKTGGQYLFFANYTFELVQ